MLDGPTIAIGTTVFEEDSAGRVLFPLIEYEDDHPAPIPVFRHEPLFKAIVDPYIDQDRQCAASDDDCVQQTGKVAIVVGDRDLNYEAQPFHKLSLALQDAWQPELVSEPIEFQVAVNDSNDVPIVVTGESIGTQTNRRTRLRLLSRWPSLL